MDLNQKEEYNMEYAHASSTTKSKGFRIINMAGAVRLSHHPTINFLMEILLLSTVWV